MNQVIVLELNPLPDFLKGHALSSQDPTSRLKETLSRWVQFVGSLWSWKNEATFAIRYVAQGGVIRVYFLAVAHNEERRELLIGDLLSLCRAHELPVELIVDEETLNEPGGPLIPLLDMALVGVRQFETRQLWRIPREITKRPEYSTLEKYGDSDCAVQFLWQAPGGSFLLPMEKLISLPVPAGLTIYLQPTELSESELSYLSTVAKAAQSTSEQQRQTLNQGAGTRSSDPLANLVGRIFTANIRRLADKPYLVSVHCTAADDRIDSAQSIAGSFEATLYETPFDLERSQVDDARLPSAGETFVPNEKSLLLWLQQYKTLRFPATSPEDERARLPWLVDARGAATAFRLPINIAGGVPGVVVKQRPPDFHPGPRINNVDPRTEIDLGGLHQGGRAKISRNAMCKHALITGFTGSGKTETVLGLVHQLHAGGTPVLALESAKREYRGLLGVPAFSQCENPLWVFSVGNETCAPFRLNPFELLPGVRVEQHIGRIQTCFEAALPPIGPLASMIGEAIVDIYEERGWRLTDVAPEVGEPMLTTFPEMADFARRMSLIPKEREYKGEVLSNVTAVVTGRIKPLTVGSKGLIFRPERQYNPGDVRQESAITQIFERSTVLELEELSVDDKAFFVMIVLTFLREYRDRHASTDGSIKHATVVEEAHNVLENVHSQGQSENSSGNSRYKTVQAFSLMLSEIRALGEGLIIADQSPEKLAPDAMRNTNLHIAHQLRDSRDREAVAHAMIMDDEQRDYLGKLEPGAAALFMTGLQKATFIKAPRYRPPVSASGEPLDDKEYPGSGFRVFDNETVRRYMDKVTSPYRIGPFDVACEPCPYHTRCKYRNAILKAMTDDSYLKAYKDASKANIPGKNASETVARYAKAAVDLARAALSTPDVDSSWCAFVHLWQRMPSNRRQTFARSNRSTMIPYIERELKRNKS